MGHTAAYWKAQIEHNGGKILRSGIPYHLKRSHRWIKAEWSSEDGKTARKIRNTFMEKLLREGWTVAPIIDTKSDKTHTLLAKIEYENAKGKT